MPPTLVYISSEAVIPAPYPEAGLRAGSLRQVRGKLQRESGVPGENRDLVFEMVPDFRRDDAWIPPCQARGRLGQARNDNQSIMDF